MGNWAAGLTQGFNTGLTMGNAFRQRGLRDQLAAEAEKYNPTEGAYGQGLQSNIEQVQGLKQQAIAGGMTPELAAQQYDPAIAELTRRSGLTAADYSVPTDTSGKNYATFAEAQRAAAPMRSEGLANVYRQAGELDKADELLARAQQSRTAALQEEAAGLAISATKRKEATDIANKNALAAIESRRAAGEPIDQKFLSVMATQYGADPKHLMDNELSKLGFDEKTLKLETAQLQKALTRAQMGGIDGMNKFLADKFDPNKNDDIVPTLRQTPNGIVVVYGNQVLSEYGSHKDLNSLVANVNGMITGDPLGAAKTLADINAKNISAQKDQALMKYYADRGDVERMGSAQYFEGSDGKMYASVPVFKKGEGVRFETVQVNPGQGVGLRKPGAGDAKPVKTPEAGEKYTVGGKPMQADGMGGFISTRGVLPDARAGAMKQLGIPDNYIGRLRWSNDGESVLFGDKRYSLVGKEAPGEVQQLLKDIEGYDVMNRRIQQSNTQRMNPPEVLTGLGGTGRVTGFGPQLTYPRN
jgi:hypothetical protein